MHRVDVIRHLTSADGPPSAHTHAWCVRLPEGFDHVLLSRTLDDAVRVWWPEPFERLPRLWSEHVPAAAGSPRAARRLDAELRRPVSAEGPLRVVLLDYSDGSADLVLVADRSILDTASLRVVADVLLGRLPATRMRVRRAPADGDNDQRQDEQVADLHKGLEWATGDAPEAAADRTGVVAVPLDGDAADPQAVLVVATAIVLGRYEGQDRPVISALVSRSRADDELGAFDSSAPLSFDVSGAVRVTELIDEARRSLSAEPPARDTGHTGHTGFVVGVLGCPALRDEERYLPFQTPPFPLTLVSRRGWNGAFSLEVHHLTRHVDADTARRFARHIARAYAQLCVATTELDPRDIDLLDEAEREWTTALGRPAAALRWQPERIEAVFTARAAERPGAAALTYEGRTLTYAELNDRADRCATALRAHGVLPGERVGICLDRSLDLVVMMLAVLKAGAVYVPMDPAYPAERLAYTTEDARLGLVVTTLGDFPRGVRTRVVHPDHLAPNHLVPDHLADVPPAGGNVTPESPTPCAGPRPGPDDPAYIIYTSGSTGRPKGVVVPHRNVIALLAATKEDFRFGPDDVWTLFHSSAFDFSVWEIWGSLLTGARLVVVPYWISRSPDRFHELLVDEGVTVLNQTPSAFAQLMETDRSKDQRLPVRLVVFGGESLDAVMLRSWFDRYPETRCRLVNMFGITETTVHVTAQTVTRRESMSGSRSVGPALSGWYVYVLDERGRPVPCGVAGEIYVGGEGVALEYFDRPELTAQRFVEDPFAGGRMYRSGDRGRLRPDGRLEHLGRLDSQVKLRGFRIELDEIRNVLLDDPAVTAAAVVLGGDSERDAVGARLDAYVVLDGRGGDGDTAAVRRRAAGMLPEHMVPATVTAMPSLPLTANGKLATDRLPDPMAADHLASAVPRRNAPAAAENDLAGRLTEVWETVLGVSVGPDDNFFELGGNSLYAVRVATVMRERGLPPLPLRELYLNPTPRGLADALNSSARMA